MKRATPTVDAWVVAVIHCSACAGASAPTALPTADISITAPVASCTTAAECAFACREQQFYACAQLAHMYETGEGAPQDLPRAAMLYAEACGGGKVDACAHVAMMHDIGLGVPRDPGKAAFLYERACAQGDRWSCTRGAELGPTSPAVGQPPQHPP